jgi:predicted ATPase
MLRKFEIENFMSLRQVCVHLSPLTVFIGPNGSGKSAIFKALTTLSRFLNGTPLRGPKGEFSTEGVNLDDIVWSGNSGLPIRFRLWFSEDAEEPGYSLELRKLGPGWSVSREVFRVGKSHIEFDETHPLEFPTENAGTKVFRAPSRATLRYLINFWTNDTVARPTIDPVIQVVEKFGLAYRYRPSASDIASFVAPPTQPGQRIYVRENGWGLAGELQALQGSDRALFEAIEQAICRVFPHIRAIAFKTDWQGVRLSFRTDRSEDLIPAPQESDGVLLATLLFWRLYTGAPSIKVCLEEPENGLHPLLMADRFRMLKEFATEGEQAKVQLLVATHSPEFLRVIKAHPTELWKEIRLVDFAAGQGTAVRGLKNFHEAANLFEQYLEEVQKRWKLTADAWK